MPITVNSIGGMHKAFTETGENRSIQRQLITPATQPSSATAASCTPPPQPRSRQRPAPAPRNRRMNGVASCVIRGSRASYQSA